MICFSKRLPLMCSASSVDGSAVSATFPVSWFCRMFSITRRGGRCCRSSDPKILLLCRKMLLDSVGSCRVSTVYFCWQNVSRRNCTVFGRYAIRRLPIRSSHMVYATAERIPLLSVGPVTRWNDSGSVGSKLISAAKDGVRPETALEWTVSDRHGGEMFQQRWTSENRTLT